MLDSEDKAYVILTVVILVFFMVLVVGITIDNQVREKTVNACIQQGSPPAECLKLR